MVSGIVIERLSALTPSRLTMVVCRTEFAVRRLSACCATTRVDELEVAVTRLELLQLAAQRTSAVIATLRSATNGSFKAEDGVVELGVIML